MRNLAAGLFAVLVLVLSAQAQNPPARVEMRPNYQSWGWDALVLENGLITLAVVPRIGARVMQYDLGPHHSMFVNEAELGEFYEPKPDSIWHNYGGYKNWPAPQDRWNWPPPPILDGATCEARIAANTPDSAVVWTASPVEQWRTPGLRFERRLSVYPGTSRVRVEQTIVNQGEQADRWSVWEISQAPVHHPGVQDFENFWVYFPLNPHSRYGARGVRTTLDTAAAWTGEVAPGIFGVRFMPLNQKLWADAPEGWICYVDEREGYAYARTFELFPGAEYPDQNATVEVWLNKDPLYLEVEVVSPIVELAPGGGRYTFVEDWWATKVKGPILRVNQVGAIARRLTVDGGGANGRYGVFYIGTARLVFLDAKLQVLGQGARHPVTPLETFSLDEEVDMPEGTTRVEVWVENAARERVGVLDSAELK
ncbi:MAG: hypothetical protein HYW07_19375 [Candidatus Latescibacteria bacterium]|nr:hypothetical protein [Candidatus Latescibacterota bacterium]